MDSILDDQTTSCNVTFCKFILDSFSVCSQVDIIYTNIAKAFDSNYHDSLISLLGTSRFNNPLLSWLYSYLPNRLQWVKLFGAKFTASSGVPQGGHLSHLLFVLFVNNVKTVLSHSKILCFAHDIKL